jgi:hypothetical protein
MLMVNERRGRRALVPSIKEMAAGSNRDDAPMREVCTPVVSRLPFQKKREEDA